MRKLGDIARHLVPAEAVETPQSRALAKAKSEFLGAGTEQPAMTVPTGEASPERVVPPSARAANRGYLARELVQCTIPHRDPKADVHIRTDGNYRVMIESGTDIRTGQKIGLPFGILPKFLMLFVNTEAVRKQGKEDELVISFGSSMNEFLRNVGCNPATGGGPRGDAARIKAQHYRLFNARFSFIRLDGDETFGSETRRPLEIAQEIRTFWDNRHHDQGSLWESHIVLNQEFQKLLVANPVPFDFEHLRALRKSALALDVYCWLTYRLFRADNNGFTVPYKALLQQFGSGYSSSDGKRNRIDNFKTALREALALVAEVYPAIRYEFTPAGLAIDAVRRRDLPVAPDAKAPALDPPNEAQAIATRALGYNPMQLAIMPADLRKVDRIARQRGLDLDEMLQKWKNWCIEERIQVGNAAAHFTAFLQRHDASRS